MLCERWDSRRGSVRRPHTLQGSEGRDNARETEADSYDRRSWEIIIVSGRLRQKVCGRSRESLPPQDHTCTGAMVLASQAAEQLFLHARTSKVRTCGPTGNHSCRMLKKFDLLTHPAPPRRDAPVREQGRRRIETRDIPLRGTLRISMSRERSWRAFSASSTRRQESASRSEKTPHRQGPG